MLVHCQLPVEFLVSSCVVALLPTRSPICNLTLVPATSMATGVHYMLYDTEVAGQIRGVRRLVCSLEATLVKAYVEVGHAWVHLKHGRLPPFLCVHVNLLLVARA